MIIFTLGEADEYESLSESIEECIDKIKNNNEQDSNEINLRDLGLPVSVSIGEILLSNSCQVSRGDIKNAGK
ncbi:hypothetical protein OnM2_093027 [Erysiphe neolycopersici]|uniref:Uncharacterized protein n=1 Tax=Erysiphe neolycopersici TaxID=212602 RepID=A0A420HC18_9PEZI|nr:hypothetical protein OnM2_093027 [Erysiphe neolycopersici]